MIQDQASFEAALQRVADLLEHPPAHGSEEDTQFTQLLHDIELYQPVMDVPAPQTTSTDLAAQADALVSRAAAFLAQRKEREKRESWSSFPEDGQGIGPTTGV
jgi:hypothetical protein